MCGVYINKYSKVNTCTITHTNYIMHNAHIAVVVFLSYPIRYSYNSQPCLFVSYICTCACICTTTTIHNWCVYLRWWVYDMWCCFPYHIMYFAYLSFVHIHTYIEFLSRRIHNIVSDNKLRVVQWTRVSCGKHRCNDEVCAIL